MRLQGSNGPGVAVQSDWRVRLPFFYGWVVIGSVFLNQAVCYAVYYSFSVFFVALIGEFGWSRASTAAVFSLYVVVFGLCGVLGGNLIDRFSPARVVPAGAVVLSMGLFATSRVSELWQFYLSFGVVAAMGSGLAGWVPAMTLASRWFHRDQGKASGIVGAGIGFGIVAMVPLAQYLISGLGWRAAYVVLSALVLFGIVPQASLLLVGRPEELGLKPDGTPASDAPGRDSRPSRRREPVVVDQKWASYPWSPSSALRTSRLWYLGAYFLLVSVAIQMLFVHQVAFLVDGGYDRMLAASVVGLTGFLSMPLKIAWGMVSDRLGREITTSMGTVAMVAGVALLLLTRVFPITLVVLLFAVVYAVGYAVSAPLGPSAAADIFRGRHFGAIYGLLGVASGTGSALGAWMAGYVFDLTGSYTVAFLAAGASAAGSALCMWLAAPRQVRRVAGRSRS